MIGVRAGIKVGLRAALAAGVSLDQIAAATASDPMAGVSRDATSGIYYPASAAEWNIALAAAGISSGNPSALWLCQEASGNLADSIGSFTLTAAGTPNYQQTITGHSRKGIVLDDGSTDAFTSASVSLPTLLTQSQLIYAVVRFPAAAPAATRALVGMGGAGTRFNTFVTTTPRIRADHGANSATGTVNAGDGAVRPYVVRHWKSQEADAYTDAEKISPASSAVVAGQGVLVGSGGATAANVGLLYMCSFHLAAGELTDAQVKTLMQTLGWTVGWS